MAMDVLQRERAPFSGRVWQEIDHAVSAVKTACCTARRFMDVTSPYGVGLTSISFDDEPLLPGHDGARPEAWAVPRREPLESHGRVPDPALFSQRGTYLVTPRSRPVAMIASEFLLGVRNVEAFEDDCQPLDLSNAVRAARDVALEEERLIYYGDLPNGYRGLLNPAPPDERYQTPVLVNPQIDVDILYQLLTGAIEELASRGYPGHYALALYPRLYTLMYGLPQARDLVVVDLLKKLFWLGVHMVPAIQPLVLDRTTPQPGQLLGVIVTGGPWLRLVSAMDWAVGYRGMSGVYHRFIIMNSFRFDMYGPAPVEVLVQAGD